MEVLQFADRNIKILGLSTQERLGAAVENILRLHSGIAPVSAPLAAQVASGRLMEEDAIRMLVQAADATTSFATLSYQFFTGPVPSLPGVEIWSAPRAQTPTTSIPPTVRRSTWRTATSISPSIWASWGKIGSASKPSTGR